MSSLTYKDGHVFNSNTRLNQRPTPSSKYKNHGIFKAAILRSYPKGDPKNRSKRWVEYDAIVTSGVRKGEIITNITPMCGFGGDKNFNEVVYQPKTQVLKGKDLGDRTPPEDTDSSHIMVQFLNGNYNFPIITGAWPQPNNQEYGATEDDGTRLKGQFQGLAWNIDKTGKLTLIFKDNKIEFDGPTGNLTINATKDTTINTKGNTSISTDGNSTINSTGTMAINASGPTTISSAAATTVSGGSGVSVTGPSVSLGSGGQPLPLGNDLVNYLNSHTHSSDNTPPSQTFSSLTSVVTAA